MSAKKEKIQRTREYQYPMEYMWNKLSRDDLIELCANLFADHCRAYKRHGFDESASKKLALEDMSRIINTHNINSLDVKDYT